MVGAFLESGGGWASRGVSLLGIGVMIFVAWLLSNNRKEVKWRPVIWGVILQLGFACVIFTPTLQHLIFEVVGDGVNRLLSFVDQGTKFVFGSFVPHSVTGVDGAPMVDSDTKEIISFEDNVSPSLINMAFVVLPSIIFFSTAAVCSASPSG